MKQKTLITRWLLMLIALLPLSVAAESTQLARWTFDTGYDVASNVYTPNTSDWAQVGWNGFGSTFKVHPNASVGDASNYYVTEKGTRYWGIMDNNGDKIMSLYQDLDPNNITDYTDASQHNQYFEIAFPTTGYKNISVSFAFTCGDNTARNMEMVVSTDGGQTWSDVGAYAGAAYWWIYNTNNVSISANNKESVIVRLIAENDATAQWRMNEISITGEEDVNNNTGTNKKVHTIGDSTMAPYNENETVTRGWGMYFGNFLTNGWTSQNYARGGRDARSGYNELWTQNAKANVQEGDYVLIQFAHNDEMFNGIDNLELMAWMKEQGVSYTTDTRGTIPSTTYKALLKKIVDEVKEKGANPVLVGPVCRKYFDSNGKIRRNGRHDLGDAYSILGDKWTYNENTKAWEVSRTHSVGEDDHTMDYPYHMKALAEEEGIPYIDMTTATKDLYESYGNERCEKELFSLKTDGTADGTHYNTTGALLAARLCAQLMKEQGILADNINVPTDLTVAPATAEMGESYIGMTLTKELTINGFGLDPTSGSVTITATEGIEISVDKNNWKQELTVDYSSGTLVKSFFARIVLTAVGKVSGTISLSNGKQSIEVPVSATGVEVASGAPVSVTWPLSENNEATVSGPFSTDNPLVNMETVDFTGGMQRLQVARGSWNVGEDDDPNRYVSYSLTSTSDNKISISDISMKVGGAGSNSMNCHIYYSTDGFQTRKTLLEKNSMADGTMYDVAAQPIISLEKGQTLDIRIYPWSTEAGSGKYICVKDVEINGVEEGAGLTNEPVTITFPFTEGKEGQSATYGPKSQAETWFKSSYVELGSNLSYNGTLTTGDVKQTLFKPSVKSSAAGNAGDYIDFCIVPKTGLVFTPTKVSYNLVRNGTGGGYTKTSWVDSEGNETEIGTFTGSKADYPQNVVHPFAYDVKGVNATGNINVLRINLYNLDNTKSVGLSDIVIEGVFTGTPQNAVQYRLTTSVNIDAAGTVTVTPAGIMFDEGDVVNVEAKKNFGYRFVEWQDADGKQISTKASVDVTMDAPKTMNAIFEKVNTYKVKTQVVAKDANDDERSLGSITLTPNDHNGVYEEGTKITATAGTSPVLNFTNWEDNSTSVERQITVGEDMTITANYEVKDFIAVFDASKVVAYANNSSYPFMADEVWDANRNAKSCIVKVSDGAELKGQGSTPVVRNRNDGIVTSDKSINGLYQNGYNTSDIAWQYQFSTVGFTSATFTAEMAAKNAATANWKAQISTDNETYADLGDAWTVVANAKKELSFTLPAEAIGKETVYVRITGTGTEFLSDKYSFTAGTFEGLDYTTNSESGVGNVYVLGEAEVEEDSEAPKLESTIPADGATGASASGRITVTFNEKIYDANSNGAVTLTKVGGNGITLTPSWSSKSVSFNYSALDYGTEYTFQMPANYVQDHSGNKYDEAVTISFTTMQRPVVTKAKYDFIVPTDGTIDEALAAANSRRDKTARYRIFIKNSDEPYVFHPEGTVTGGDGKTYDNPISILTASNTSFIGESIEGVVLTNITPGPTWNNGFGDACPLEGIGKGDVLQIKGENSYFQNLTIKTSMGDAHGRDIAVNDFSNRTIFKDAQLWGYQDTYVSNNQNGKYYFEGGVIRGRTDFMCGKGDVYYNKVTLRQVASGYTAVPSQPKKYGYIYQSCKIVGDKDSGVDGTYTLGRPWGKGTPIALFIDTEMEVKPSAIGWSEMSGGYPARFAEYGSHTPSGAAVSTEGRKTQYDAYDDYNKETGVYTNRRIETCDPILTAEEAAVPTLAAVMGQDDEWQPALLTEQAPVPTDLAQSGFVLSWTGSEYALLYAIVKDGQVIDFTTESEYTLTENGEYAVRAANEMGGLSAASDAITVSDINKVEPIEEEKTVDLPTTGVVTNTVVDDVYYNLDTNSSSSDDDGSYLSIGQTTDMSSIEDMKPGSTDIKDNFNGMILMVGEGSGKISVSAKTEGNAKLAVKVGNGAPTTAQKTTKGDVEVNYNVSEDTYVYIYSEGTSSGQNAIAFWFNNITDDAQVKIYGITVTPETTAVGNISANGNSGMDDSSLKVIKNGKLYIGDYNVSGHRVK